jgi:hypothetical protein
MARVLTTMQPTILDRILYAQVLTESGFTIHAITEIRHTRGNSVVVAGSFERYGTTVDGVEVEAVEGGILIAEQMHYANVRQNGAFELFTAHGDGE